jgi:hypothetical protein
MGAMLDTAHSLATSAQAAGIKAYTDPAEAFNNRPCLLIAPPRIDFTTGLLSGEDSTTWRVIALSSYDAGQLASLDELERLIELAVAGLDIDSAEPIAYPFGATRVAAYLLTTTFFD